MLSAVFSQRQRHTLRYCTGKSIYLCGDPIYVVGDSHVFFFSGIDAPQRIPVQNPYGVINTASSLLPIFRIYHVGPGLAYSLNRPGSSNQTVEKIHYLLENGHIPQKSTVLLCFGEIDCRVHLAKEKWGDEDDLAIDRTVEAYLSMVKYLKQQGHQLLCWAPIASQRDDAPPNSEFPRSGNEVERNRITRRLGAKLREATGGDAIVLSIFEQLVTQEDRTQEGILYDGCHLSREALPLMGREFLEKQVFRLRPYTLLGPSR
jgi:hypothetical protein